MAIQKNELPAHHQTVVSRLIAACQADARVVAAFLGGSHARGAADEHSDLDLCVITTGDAAFEALVAERESFIRLLGEPVFLESFARPHIAFFVLADGVEGELYFGSVGHLDDIQSGSFIVLLDKAGILAGATFVEQPIAPSEQAETLRSLIYGFWHELSHFVTAMHRKQTWWAFGQLEALRRNCVSLLRLRHNFSVWAGGDEPYFKVEKELPVEQLSPLQATICLMEPTAMRDAARVIHGIYCELAQSLAQTHGLAYPVGLDRVMSARLETLFDEE
jgi:predicted nucleotidyltransferase